VSSIKLGAKTSKVRTLSLQSTGDRQIIKIQCLKYSQNTATDTSKSALGGP
jgi:hypothetical protein